jgi:hypothetical protein
VNAEIAGEITHIDGSFMWANPAGYVEQVHGDRFRP